MAEENPFNLEDLVVRGGAVGTGTKTKPKTAKKKATRLGEPFIMITISQARKLDGAASLYTPRVFRYLLFMEFRVLLGTTFTLPRDVHKKFGISRMAKKRALAELERLGLVVVENEPPELLKVTIVRPGSKPQRSKNST
jgi:hypothetical protein